MSTDLVNIKKTLSNYSLKATHSRLVVLSHLQKTAEHPTAEMVFDTLSEDNPSISKATVYRILDDFAEVGLVKRVANKDGLNRYDANLEPHSHIISTNTNEIQDYMNEELNELIHQFFKNKQFENFNVTDIKLQINGEKIDPQKSIKIL